MNSTAVSGVNIEKTFDSDFTLFVSQFNASYGKVYGFYGPNGSGKTTFLKILGLIMAPDSGEIFINGYSASVYNLEIKRKMSFVFQEPKLLKRKVKDNLIYPLKLRNETVYLENINRILKKLSLNPHIFLHKKPLELSGGEKKRLSLAQKLIFDPDIILLDEPTANVDSTSLSVITGFLTELKKQNKCIIVSSHDYEWLTDTADKIYYLNNGRLYTQKYENDLGRGFEYFAAGLYHKRFAKTDVIVSSPEKSVDEGCYINPEDILIALDEPQKISARNVIKMRVNDIEIQEKKVKIGLVKDDLRLVSYISKKALLELDLSKNKEVYVVFKASSAKWYK
ncbi:ATP-binding cassette domain-containing protein [Flexistipes sp.]|uniref:ATP-binding cassette domain-containing protein n=1 Tax=Flexistipes sp. TaxID=3088135 RepID=UPI002E2164AE|nr:ATP-binding cassette domain-containing protein [Flexistipes sp.]